MKILKRAGSTILIIVVLGGLALLFSKDQKVLDFRNCKNGQDVIRASDGKCFTEISGTYLLTDGREVFGGGGVLPLDLKSLKVINREVVRDRNGLYVLINAFPQKIEDLNPDSARIIFYGENGSFLLSDNVSTYIVNEAEYRKLPIINGSFLQDSYYFKGSNAVYYRLDAVNEADPQTFVLVKELAQGGIDQTNHYAKDDRNVYFDGKIIDGADPESFFVFPALYSQRYAKDSRHVFMRSEVIVGADPGTFEVLGRQVYEGCGKEGYSKDRNSVYFETKKVIGADPTTFEPLINGYGKDKSHSFLKGEMISTPPDELEVVCNYG